MGTVYAGVSASNNNNAHQSSFFPIDSLPDVVLAHVFQALDWRSRMRVERVSPKWNRIVRAHGWLTHHSFDFNENFLWKLDDVRKNLRSDSDSFEKVYHLLTRCGPHLRELTWSSVVGEKYFCALLRLCPRVRHLLLSMYVRPGELDCIRLTLSHSLRSLHLENCLSEYDTRLQITSLNQLLDECSRLEYLYFYDSNPRILSTSLKIPPSIRVLALCGKCTESTANSLFCDSDSKIQNNAANAGLLRALRLKPTTGQTLVLPAMLSSQLVYLGVELSTKSETNFLHSLANLPQLKALEMWGVSARVLANFAESCARAGSRLEHLSITACSLADLPQQPATTPTNYCSLNSLISLHLDYHFYGGGEEVTVYHWLGESVLAGAGACHQLQHVVFKFPKLHPPTQLLCQLIRGNKMLRYIHIERLVNPDELEWMNGAAEEASKEWPKENLPIINIRSGTIDHEQIRRFSRSGKRINDRIRVLNTASRDYTQAEREEEQMLEKEACSLLRRYQYGSLTEGPPSWSSPK